MSSARQSLNRMARKNRLEGRAAGRGAKPKAPATPAPEPKPKRASKPAATSAPASDEHAARSPLSLKPSPRPEPPPRPDTVDELVGRCSATDEEADLTACYRDRELATCPKCHRTFCENCLSQHIASRHGRSHV